MSHNPYVQFYTSDFLGGTSGMTAACKGVYITLLCQMYEEERPLGQSWEMLARRCGCTLPAFKRAISDLVDDGKIIITDDGIWSPKCEKHIALRRERQKSASSAAKKRWEKTQQKQDGGNADAVRAQCQPEPEPEPYNNDDTNVSSRRSAKDEGFLEFWEIWPSKKNKQNAIKAWRKLTIEDKRAAYSAIRAGWFDQWQAASPDANPIHAATFINNRRWEDQQAAPRAKKIDGGTNAKRPIFERLEARFAEMDSGQDRDPSQPLLPTSHR